MIFLTTEQTASLTAITPALAPARVLSANDIESRTNYRLTSSFWTEAVLANKTMLVRVIPNTEMYSIFIQNLIYLFM